MFSGLHVEYSGLLYALVSRFCSDVSKEAATYILRMTQCGSSFEEGDWLCLQGAYHLHPIEAYNSIFLFAINEHLKKEDLFIYQSIVSDCGVCSWP